MNDQPPIPFPIGARVVAHTLGGVFQGWVGEVRMVSGEWRAVYFAGHPWQYDDRPFWFAVGELKEEETP